MQVCAKDGANVELGDLSLSFIVEDFAGEGLVGDLVRPESTKCYIIPEPSQWPERSLAFRADRRKGTSLTCLKEVNI